MEPTYIGPNIGLQSVCLKHYIYFHFLIYVSKVDVFQNDENNLKGYCQKVVSAYAMHRRLPPFGNNSSNYVY